MYHVVIQAVGTFFTVIPVQSEVNIYRYIYIYICVYIYIYIYIYADFFVFKHQ
jgi:hypothetical protein